MNLQELQKIEKWFCDYAQGFKQGGVFAPRQQIKYDHSFRVAEEAEGLARDMNWPEAEIHTARAIGILHDVGRFTQFAEFGTFVDQKSVNHALRGLEVLERENSLAEIPEEERRIILDAVHWHNTKTFPLDLPKNSDRFVRLIRDADKLDGFWIIHDALAGSRNRMYQDLFIGKSMTDKANPELVKTVKAGQLVTYKDVKCVADYLILQIGWVYDVNYPVALRRIRDRKILEHFKTYLPEDASILEAVDVALAFLAKTLR